MLRAFGRVKSRPTVLGIGVSLGMHTRKEIVEEEEITGSKTTRQGEN